MIGALTLDILTPEKRPHKVFGQFMLGFIASNFFPVISVKRNVTQYILNMVYIYIYLKQLYFTIVQQQPLQEA